MSQQQQITFKTKFQTGYFRLTHQLLKNVKINQITFGFLRLIQILQIIHFIYRQNVYGQWNNTILKYTELVMNYISIDYLIQSTPGIFISISVGLLVLMVLTIVVMGLLGWRLYVEKKPSSFMKSVFTMVNFSLYLFKTILQIPVINVILIAFSGEYKKNLGISGSSGVDVLIGVINLILFIMIQVYLTTSFKDCNPFSDLIHSGQNITKSITFLAYKFIFTLYLALDYKGKSAHVFLIIFFIINILWVFYQHYQIGYYKLKIRNICLKLNYVLLTFSFISMIKKFKSNDQMSILLFLIILYIMCYIICDYVENKICLKIVEQQMMFIKNENDLQEHIINLIRYIDTFEKRQSRILLEGYLLYHHRQCKLSQVNCICHHLIQIKQRTNQQKYEFFTFLIDILKQNLVRFGNDSKKVHLLLSFIYQYRLKNRFQSIYSITRTLNHDTFINRLYFYHQINLIQSQMIQDDSKDSTNKAIDINKFFDYNNLIVSFQQMIQDCTRNHISFWKELLEVNTDIKKLQKSGTSVTNSKDNVRDEFEKMLVMNPNNIHTLTVYGRFLIDVANQEASNIKYLQKAESILKNLKQSSKIDDTSNKYTDNAQTTIIIINGNEGHLGEIVHTNNYVKKMLGYKRTQVTGTNVNAVMPKIFGESHNQVLEKYLSTSSDKYNGKQRVVPALGKDGYMIPVVALTKALPNLEHGIRIVGFISKLQQRPEEQQIVRKYFYILYRTDNQQIVGITQNCYSQFHIPCCLIYGNPYNNNNQLKIRNLFGFSFQKDKQGQVATALQTSQVVLTLNSTKLSEEFVITRSMASQQIKDDLLHLDSSDFGVEVKIVAKCILTYNYRGIPLKMLSIYKYGQDCFQNKNEEFLGSKKTDQNTRYLQKTQNDDFKDLKDFKNFISIKSQPSAISIINNICCVLMFVIATCIIVFIVIWTSLKSQNTKILQGSQRSLKNQIIVPNMLFEVEKFYINRNPDLSLNKFDQTLSRSKITNMINLIKKNQREFLPIKFYFIGNDYNRTVTQYSFDTFGQTMTKPMFIDEIVTVYISQVEALMDSQLDGTIYTNPVRYDSNPFLIYLAIKNNEMFSIRQGSLATFEDVMSSYSEQVSQHRIIFYLLSSLMFFAVILWYFTSIPYVLSVSKINNRVLSLFSLIPNRDVLKLIGRCYLYMKENLTEAIVQDDDVQELLDDGPMDKQDKQDESFLGASSLGFGVSSPAPFLSKNNSNLDSSSPSMFKKSSSNSAFNQGVSPLTVQQKFSKMVNSQNQQKNITIIQFLVVSLLLIGYFLFNHFYAFSNVNNIQLQTQNLKNMGRRISVLTNVKLLLTEYIMNDQYQLAKNLPTIKELNNKIIDQSYAIERVLLNLNIDSQKATYSKYDTGNLCNFISEYQTYSIFQTAFDKTQCLNLKSGILAKGIKTAIVTVLQEVRTILSQPITNRSSLLQQKIIQYEKLIKYLQNPMLKIISGTQAQVTQTNDNYQLVLIITSTIFLVILIGFWRIIWTIYIEELNNKIWRTKGMLNIIPMRIITANQMLKNQFASGQLEKAVR